jgi:hypothetical protein
MKEAAMEVIPFISIGLLTFGDSRQVAREKLASMFSTFAKVAGANETDAFDELGLHLYYDRAGQLEFVEAFAPANVVFRGVSFLGRDLESVTSDMKALGFDPTGTDVGIDFPDAGVALTAPSGIIEGAAAHRKGYYDS